MAEVLVKVGDRSDRPDDWKDGHVISAANSRWIGQVHAELVCFSRDPATRLFSRLRSNGCFDLDDVARDFMEATHEFRCERLSQDELQITKLSTSQVLRVVSEVPFTGFSGKRGLIDVELYLRRRLQTSKKPIFGSPAQAVWYGGEIDLSEAAISRVWTAIAAKEGKTRDSSEFAELPRGGDTLRHHLVLPVEDFDDATAAAWVAPVIDDSDPENLVVVQRSSARVSWPDLFPMDIPPTTRASDVADRGKTVDVRRRSAGPFRHSIVEVSDG